MKTITLKDEEFKRLYDIIEREYGTLCERVKVERPGLSNNIEDYLTHDIYTNLNTIKETK
jgi:hypothetical protein